MNQNELLKLGREKLKKEKIEETDIKAKTLLEYILNQSKEQFIINSLSEVLKVDEEEYLNKIQEIIDGRPLQYITNNQNFMGIKFYVDENVLVPQPDTEILVQKALEYIDIVQEKQVNDNDVQNTKLKEKKQVLDLCTGSGIIAVSILKHLESLGQYYYKKGVNIKGNINMR